MTLESNKHYKTSSHWPSFSKGKEIVSALSEEDEKNALEKMGISADFWYKDFKERWITIDHVKAVRETYELYTTVDNLFNFAEAYKNGEIDLSIRSLFDEKNLPVPKNLELVKAIHQKTLSLEVLIQLKKWNVPPTYLFPLAVLYTNGKLTQEEIQTRIKVQTLLKN